MINGFMKKTFAKKTLVFLGSYLKILTFLTSFTKSKTETNGHLTSCRGPYFCTDWALWAGLVIELTCPCVCVSVCMCHCKTPKGPIADFGRQSHNVTFILFWIFQLDVSLLCRPNLIGLVFSSKLQLPNRLENFNMISFALTILVTSCSNILSFLFLSLL